MHRDMEGHIPYMLLHERNYMKEGSLKRIHVIRFYLWSVPKRAILQRQKTSMTARGSNWGEMTVE